MAVTLKEIAYASGFDVSVISRVLNGKANKYRISKRCQEKIKKIAAKMGYVPNGYAVGIKDGEFHCVALLHNGLDDRSYLPEKLIGEIHRNLERQESHLLLANISDAKVDKQELPKIFRSLMADGLIVNHHHVLPAKVKTAISNSPMPTVWINDKLEYNSVYPDSFSAAKRATQYLIDLGHKRISYCNVYFEDLKPNAHYSVADRRGGYIEAMQQASLKVMDITPDHRIDDDLQKQEEYFYSMLKKPQRPTAMLFYWSYCVPALFAAAARLRLKIPNDLSVIAFAGESHQRIGITISVMLEPEINMGREAVAMLSEKMRTNQKKVPSKVLKYSFFDMKTCAGVNRGLSGL